MQAAPSGREASYTSGVVLMCAGVACLSANDAVAKALTSHYPPLEILFLRNVVAFPFTVLIAITMGGRQALKTYRPAAHMLRGALWVCATMMFFTSFIYLGLAEATALIFVAPFFITLISALFLGEKVHIRRWLAVLFGFLGVLVVIRPGGATFQAASLLPVATALVYALLMLSARWVDARESVWTLLVYLTGTAALISVFIVPFVWVPVRLEDLWLFAAIAIFGTAGMTMMTQAFRLTPAVIVAPLDYTALIWATLFGWLIWRESPDAATFLGAAIIIASGVFTIFRQKGKAA
ncbi:DMT family transporter [Martelella mediterranea]|uniref:DMT family transporter n=1 Tax=Martelella mediterranea TaxID=293089 RepID=UPI001E3DB62B|nr:DMT family transporter [Martelella mediterranea]MCD1632246.1 DMT family transporter [Martelella mediterranea]